MTSETMIKDDLSPGGAEAWAGLFDVRDDRSMHVGQLRQRLLVQRDDVLTAKLRTTVNFYKAVEDRAFPVLPGGLANLGRVLDIFCVLATFDNLARARYGELRKPAFWVRIGEGRRLLAPAMPIEEAARLTETKPSLLRASLVPMVKDGAVEFIRAPSGVNAILVTPGFVNTLSYRGLLQV